MPSRFLRQPFSLGLFSLFLLAAATAWLFLGPEVGSAGEASVPETDYVFRLSIVTNEITYNPADQMLYATRPSSIGAGGNSISRIDPLTGAVVGSVYVGSEPNKMALSDNGQTMYVTLDGAYAIRRYETSTQTPGIQFSVGRESTQSFPLGTPWRASDIAVAPGNPNILAVSRFNPDLSPPGTGTAIFDNGVRRPNTGPGHSDAANYLAFSSSASTLYGGGYDGGLRTMTVDANGVTDITGNPTSFPVRSLKFQNNLVFTSTGQIINPETRTLLGTCAGVNTLAFVPDTATGRVLYAQKDPSGPNVIVKACDINTFQQIGSPLIIPNVGFDFFVTTLVRYGTNGLAMRTTNNQIYFIQTDLLPTGSPLPTPSSTPANTPTPTPTVFSKFIRSVALPNKDLLYRNADQKFYVTVPNSAGAPRANTVTRIEPTTGALETSVAVGTDPGRLAFSDDDQTMYIGIDGANAVRKFDMATQTPGLQFPLGVGVNGPKIAHDIDVMPGNSNAVAVSYGTSSYNYDGADIYDDGVKRAQKANASGPVEFVTASTLYVGENWLYKYAVSGAGLSLLGNVTTNSYLEAEIHDGLLYTAGGGTSGGGVMDLTTADFRGSFRGLGYPSVVCIDPPNNRAFFLTQGDLMGGNGWTIKAFRLDNFLPVGSITLPASLSPNQRRLFRWGTNGLAFADYGYQKIYFIQSDLVSTSGTLPSALQLGAATYSNSEAGPTFPVTVTRTGGLTGTSTVNYATTDGTATAGSDYTATSGTLTFAAGESSKTINIPLFNDNVFEGNETFGIALSNPGGDGTVELLDPVSAVLTIQDNDSQPSLSSANITVSEPRIIGATTAVVTVQLSNPTTQTATVNYSTSNGSATAGNDYLATSGQLTFAPLETTKTVQVQVLADQAYTEPTEFFFVNFSNSVNCWILSQSVQVTITNYNPATARHASFDFDDDGKTDIGIFRPSVAEWWYQRSGDGQVPAFQFGATGDEIVPGDYTGDGKTDIAVWRPMNGTWFIFRSEDLSFYSFPFGTSGDVPVPGDYDADGKIDPAVFRPSTTTWFIKQSSNDTVRIFQFGAAGDQPVVADYDGDRKADAAIYRPSSGQWWISRSTLGVIAVTFGESTDKPVQGDYTGDGKADVAFWRPSTGEWYVLRSQDFSYYSQPFGTSGDIPAPGDYDGDGKYDATVFRPANATWYSQRSTAGTLIQQFGSAEDMPIPSAFIP